jgi:hypothetical protein
MGAQSAEFDGISAFLSAHCGACTDFNHLQNDKFYRFRLIAMPKDPQSRNTSRRRPVSCQFCRMRKLRCSRTAPCSNCIVRGISCDLANQVPLPTNGPEKAPSTSEYSEILERLHRLESLLISQRDECQRSDGQPSEGTDSRSQPVHLSASPPQIQNLTMDNDTSLLGDVSMDQALSVSAINTS